MVWTREGRVTVKGTTYEAGYPKCGNQSGRRPALDTAKIAAAIASFAPTRIPAYFQLNRFEFASFIRNVLLLDIMRWRKENAIDWIFFHQLGGHRFYPPDFCIVSKLRWRHGATSVWWHADLHHATVWSQLHWAWAVGVCFVKRPIFPSRSLISQPTLFFGSWRSTSGLSLFGITPRLRKRKPVGWLNPWTVR